MTARFIMARSLRALLLMAILMSLLALTAPTSAYAGPDTNWTAHFPRDNRTRKCQCGW